MIAEASGVHNLKILVVEDNLINQFVMQETLQQAGFSVYTADRGEEALRRCAEAGPDLVLLDLQLPAMDGFAVIRALRKQGFHAPVVALTGYDDRETRLRCGREGFAGFLSKPASQKELLGVIHSCLNVETVSDGRDANGSRETKRSIARRIEETIAARGYTEENRRRMLEIAPKEIRQHMTAISDALAAGDYRTIARETHSLKGSFGALGLMDYHRMAAQMHLTLRIYFAPELFEAERSSAGLLFREREGVNSLLLSWEEAESPDRERVPDLLLEYFRESFAVLNTDELSCFTDPEIAG
jgi:CheY-like chemotaxis protein